MDEQGTIKTEEQGAIRTQPHKSFGPMEFLWRWAASLLLVLGTWNPSGLSYVNWVVDAFGSEAGFGALHLFVGAILLAGWAVFWIATNNALGAFGTVLAALVIGSAIWLLADFGLVNADSTQKGVWIRAEDRLGDAAI